MFLSSSDVMSGNVLSCLKGVKDTSVAQEGRWDFSGKSYDLGQLERTFHYSQGEIIVIQDTMG